MFHHGADDAAAKDNPFRQPPGRVRVRFTGSRR
jgi:hypothetical protein